MTYTLPWFFPRDASLLIEALLVRTDSSRLGHADWTHSKSVFQHKFFQSQLLLPYQQQPHQQQDQTQDLRIELAELKAEKMATASAQEALKKAQEKALEAQHGQMAEKAANARLEAELQVTKEVQKNLLVLAKEAGEGKSAGALLTQLTTAG